MIPGFLRNYTSLCEVVSNVKVRSLFMMSRILLPGEDRDGLWELLVLLSMSVRASFLKKIAHTGCKRSKCYPYVFCLEVQK
jgi:hypothetical protein